MAAGWLATACGIRVDHNPCPRPGGRVDTTKAPAGVLHTVEGSFEGGMSVFRQHFAPNFLVGAGRISQLVPLGYMAAALEHTASPPTNEWARVQIEVAGHSQETPYRFDARTEETLAHLLAALAILGVAPLSRPFPDILPPPPWATPYFVRRNAGLWGRAAGWFGHIEVPENSHWDPGAYEWTHLLERAKQIKAAHSAHAPLKRLPHPSASLAALYRRLNPRKSALA